MDNNDDGALSISREKKVGISAIFIKSARFNYYYSFPYLKFNVILRGFLLC